MGDKDSQALLERLNTDEGFRERFEEDISGALAELSFTPSKRAALVSTDEDSLRRLAGADVVGIECGRIKSWITRHLCTWIFCGPPGTRDPWCPRQP
jgi:hypothetical protein